MNSKAIPICIRSVIRGLIVMAGVLVVCLPSFSQVNQGRILGTVTDQTGGVISGASVSVIDVARGVTHLLVTDSAGDFQIPGLIPGLYTVRAESKGFKVTERQNITVEVGTDVRVDLTLEPGEQTQTVTVTEAPPVMNTTNTELGGTVEEQQYADLPITGRQYYHLLDFAPGVLAIPGGDSIGYASNGGRTSNTYWMLDGVDETEMWSGTGPVAGQRQDSIMPVDAITGVNVIQNPGSEYGWRVGAIINMGIKSGSNDIHGTAYFFDRNTAMDAKNPFLTASQAKNADLVEDFGASFGGPVKKDKLFYFASFEGEYFAVGNPYQANEPTMLSLGGGTTGAANSFPDAIADLNSRGIPLSPLSLALAGCTSSGTCNPAKGVFGAFPASGEKTFAFNDQGNSFNGVGKIDYHLNDHHSFNVEYFAGDGDESSPASIQNWWLEGSPQVAEVGRGVWIWTPNSTWVNQARFGSDLSHGPVLPEECVANLGQPNYATAFGYTPGTAGNPPSCAGKAFSPITIGNFATLGNDSGGTSQLVTHYAWLDTVSYTRGKHLIKFGAEFHIVHFTGFGKLSNLIGTTDFGNGGTPAIFTCPVGGAITTTCPTAVSGTPVSASPLEDFLAGYPDTGALLIGTAQQHFNMDRYAGFIQDDWRILPKLTVNFGLRYEFQMPITSTTNAIGNFDPSTPSGLVQETGGHALYTTSTHGFGPRLGFVWDPTGKGTTVVRLGGSIVDDNLINFNDLLHTVNGASLQVIPTGWLLENANGTLRPNAGTIEAGTVTLTGNTYGQAPLGQLTWAQNTPIFNTTSSALACGNGLGSNAAPCALSAINPHIRQSYVSTWTLSVEHAFTNNLGLDISYVGNHGTALAGIIDVNQPALGAKGSSAEQQRRPYYTMFPYLGQIRYYTPDLDSNYNGLQAYLTERITHGLTFNAGYTYSHALDDTSSIQSFNAYDNSNPNLNYGNSSNDVRNHFTFTATYNIPAIKSPEQVLQGWKVSTTVNLLGRFPYNALDTSSDLSGTGEKADRWNLVGPATSFNTGAAAGGALTGLPCFGVKGSTFATGNCTVEPTLAAMPQICQAEAANEPVNPSVPVTTKNATGLGSNGVLINLGCYVSADGKAAIVPPTQGTFGDMARDLLRDRPFREWDLNLTKVFRFNERYSFEVRGDFYNIINSVEYAVPSGNPASPLTFGQAQGTISSSATVSRSGAPRNIMLGAKFIF